MKDFFQVFGIDITDNDPTTVCYASMDKSFIEALVGILQFYVFTDKGYVDLVLRVPDHIDNAFPLGEIRLLGPYVE